MIYRPAIHSICFFSALKLLMVFISAVLKQEILKSSFLNISFTTGRKLWYVPLVKNELMIIGMFEYQMVIPSFTDRVWMLILL